MEKIDWKYFKLSEHPFYCIFHNCVPSLHVFFVSKYSSNSKPLYNTFISSQVESQNLPYDRFSTWYIFNVFASGNLILLYNISGLNSGF